MSQTNYMDGDPREIDGWKFYAEQDGEGWRVVAEKTGYPIEMATGRNLDMVLLEAARLTHVDRLQLLALYGF